MKLITLNIHLDQIDAFAGLKVVVECNRLDWDGSCVFRLRSDRRDDLHLVHWKVEDRFAGFVADCELI